MTRAIACVLAAAVVLLIGFMVVRHLEHKELNALRDRAGTFALRAVQSNRENTRLTGQLAADSVERDSIIQANDLLRRDLARARSQTTRLVQVRDSAAATIDVDTLSAGLRNLLSIERDVADSFRAERDLERTLRESAEQQVAQLLERQRALRILLLDVTAQRDSALALANDAIDFADPGFFRNLFQDLPRKAACAGGGAIVAEVNKGNILTGAAIGLGVCLAVEAIF